MKRVTVVLVALLWVVGAAAQSVVTPVFTHKDGEASAAGYTGSEKDILVDGHNMVKGWITFQTQGVNLSQITSGVLVLYVKSVAGAGTVDVYGLTEAINRLENNVRFVDIVHGSTPAASIAIGTGDAEKVVQVNVTTLLKSGTFYGVALVSEDGAEVNFSSKEGTLMPLLLLTYDVASAAAAWLSESGVPASSLGKDGDFYLNTANGDVYSKAGGGWTLQANIKGPKGDKGDQGERGLQGEKGEKGDEGPAGPRGHSPMSTSTTTLDIAATGTITLALADNILAFGAGQRVRIAQTSAPANLMEGTVTAVDTSTRGLTVQLDYSEGSGTDLSDWTVVTAGAGANLADNSVTSAKIVDGAVGVVDVDTTQVQARVSGTCPAGSSIRVISSDGTVTCEPDDDTQYSAGTGLTLTGTTFAVNTTTIQARVTETCAAGNSIRAIAADGTVTCEPDDNSGGDITDVVAGTGLSGGGTSGSVTLHGVARAFTTSGATTPIPAGRCTTYTGAMVTVTASGPGVVVVTWDAQLQNVYTVSGRDDVLATIGRNPTDCSMVGGSYAAHAWPAGMPSGAGTYYITTVGGVRRFVVSSPGDYTFYLNGFKYSPNSNTVNFYYANLSALFIPD